MKASGQYIQRNIDEEPYWYADIEFGANDGRLGESRMYYLPSALVSEDMRSSFASEMFHKEQDPQPN